MTARLFDIDHEARALMDDAAIKARDVGARGRAPALVLVMVGADAATRTYVARKEADCARAGIAMRIVSLPPGTTQDTLLAAVRAACTDTAVDGVMVQLPLPAHLHAEAVIAAITPEKDVDGLTPRNTLALTSRAPAIVPCTVRAIAWLLARAEIATAGARMAIVGRGRLVGRPASLLFSGFVANAEVTLLHRGTRDLGGALRRADIVIAAAGSAGLIMASDLKPGSAVLDIGMSWPNGVLAGDVAPDAADVAGWITPPGASFGPMTRAMLLQNLLDCAQARSGS
ncbi:bifunctional 5,10-methylenetetrahydrofolate dehydrogenase/5,10-methenyltetrahydrofolate cyclohydrolase [Tanticharoenia sakaeratensis]|uniref:Bifunctional protein FolD n=1 Tax=Tanticharoenia sakaeratensis NBRC 103193 TaxID=1231623 RepID=A0A0D6MP90_9PROT|nr:bifunctional 5,10-methylenetetrahydrofolate dehydrogenase/5,10-methenyltetrahydrofolate cyclohydrolase [Tanticharoenia sakaeratensis]GAN55494.1 protein folD 2 [Tanticharoenia sakaeratensis NBRC 103193]GBQ21912.1 5,10-methylene-tetrahydrofolate dehydrogenase [Tanticharoenia sakaeratensis NBRC 103193]